MPKGHTVVVGGYKLGVQNDYINVKVLKSEYVEWHFKKQGLLCECTWALKHVGKVDLHFWITSMTKAVESILMFVLVFWFSDAKGNNHNYAKGE